MTAEPTYIIHLADYNEDELTKGAGDEGTARTLPAASLGECRRAEHPEYRLLLRLRSLVVRLKLALSLLLHCQLLRLWYRLF